MKLVLLTLLLALPSWHRVATTQLEMQLDAESGVLEIALHISPNDLETCLTQTQGRPIRLEREKKIDALIASYVEEHFFLTNAKGEVIDFTWVGKEIELRDVWIYFELDVHAELKDLQVHDDLLEGLHHDYVSTLSLSYAGNRKHSLRFDRERKIQTLLAD